MGKRSKRKFHDFQAAQHSQNLHVDLNQGVASFLTTATNSAPGEGVVSSTENVTDTTALTSVQAAREQWQTVKRSKRRRINDEEGRTKYPELINNRKISTPIRIADLQTLALYTLADGVAPSWLAFKYAHHTRKVVVLMVPGLEMGMFNNPKSFPELDTSEVGPESDAMDQDGETSEVQKSESTEPWTLVTGKGNNTTPLSKGFLPTSLKPLADIFDDVWSVKAAGDSKYLRLHSPIQSMLVAPLQKAQEEKTTKGKGARPPREEKGWKPQRTPVTRFVHTAEELQDADYPVHLAAFENYTEAALLEQERRSKTGQDVSSGWVDTLVSSVAEFMVPEAAIQSGSVTAGRIIYSIDCEMVQTSDEKFSLARISILDWDGKTILDELVKPNLPITNYFTQYSGITEDLLKPVTTTLKDIQVKLLALFTPRTILLGHSLESDLNALKMTQPFIVDTSLLYPHARGPPLRNSLRFLTQKYLRREIQQSGAKGHDSVEDALAVLDLVKLKCEKGPKWGTAEASGEPIFRRLGRAKFRDTHGHERAVRSAIVDYGTPERGYGREADVHIAANSDEEVIQGVLRAVNGDTTSPSNIDKIKSVSQGGVEFVWARLREV